MDNIVGFVLKSSRLGVHVWAIWMANAIQNYDIKIGVVCGSHKYPVHHIADGRRDAPTQIIGAHGPTNWWRKCNKFIFLACEYNVR